MLSGATSALSNPHSPSSAGTHTATHGGCPTSRESTQHLPRKHTDPKCTTHAPPPTRHTPSVHTAHSPSIPLQGTQSQHTNCTVHLHTHARHTREPHSDSTPPRCFETALLLPKIIVVIRSSHKGRVTDGDKLAGKKTAMHRYLKKRRANTSNLRKANRFIWEVYKKKKKNQAIFN